MPHSDLSCRLTRGGRLLLRACALVAASALTASAAGPVLAATTSPEAPMPAPESLLSESLLAGELLGSQYAAAGLAPPAWSLDASDTSPSHYYVWCPSATVPPKNAPRDANGIVMKRYGSSGTPVYNPTEIAQYSIHWYEMWLHDRTDWASLAEFKRHAAWLRDKGMDSEGRFPYKFSLPGRGARAPWYSAMAQGLGISVLLRAYSLTGDWSYVNAAKKAFRPFSRDISSGGVVSGGGRWLEEYPDGHHVLNGSIFAMYGLYDLWRVTKDAAVKRAFDLAVGNLADNIGRYESHGAVLYELLEGNFSHPVYYRLHIQQLRSLAWISGRPNFAQTAARWSSLRAYPAPELSLTAASSVVRGDRVAISGKLRYLYRRYYPDNSHFVVKSRPLGSTAPFALVAQVTPRRSGDTAYLSWATPPVQRDMEYEITVYGQPVKAPLGYRYEQKARSVKRMRILVPRVDGATVLQDFGTPNGDGWADSTYVRYRIGETAGKVYLKVYDSAWNLERIVPGKLMSGSHVAQAPGLHFTRFDFRDGAGRPLSNGLHYLIVSAGNLNGQTSSVTSFRVASDVRVAPALGTAPALYDVRPLTNPFSPNGDGTNDYTRLCFTLSQEAYVTVKVLSSRGEVATVVRNSRLRAGRHFPPWSGRGADGRVLPAGTYSFYVFASGGGLTPRTALRTGLVTVRP